MMTKPIPFRLVVVALGLMVSFGPALFYQREVLSAGSPEPAQQQTDVDSTPVDSRPLKLTPHRVLLSKTKKFNLYLPPGFEITVAAQGLKRARFMATSVRLNARSETPGIIQALRTR